MPKARGFALITALIFLVVLTLVAVIAMKGSGLELRMSSNNAQHAEAFESSEAPRRIASRLLQVLGDNLANGWPASIGGNTPNDLFNYTIPPGMSIYNAGGTAGGTPLNWFDIPESDFSYTEFRPKARYEETITVAGSAPFKLSSEIDVQLMRKAFRAGCEISSGGYDELSSKNCLDFFFLVSSRGQDPSGAASYETATVYRFLPRR